MVGERYRGEIIVGVMLIEGKMRYYHEWVGLGWIEGWVGVSGGNQSVNQ